MVQVEASNEEAGQTENSDEVKKKKNDDWCQFQCSGKYWNFVDYHLQNMEVKARKNAKTQTKYQFAWKQCSGTSPDILAQRKSSKLAQMSALEWQNTIYATWFGE
ncbi:hypothetical protein SERLA73DRAFT_152443 [Serpula lacrymans var. lacrymans S7.3]|uniref:Uncharacterized protein n=1 Tax=Serpula lacrymans var. lacrymans (strain S7.3) TaxID=936435 RepID=F8PUP7_SERL3|nr:hypothetical protein SERLA73DRAFT_152443 [Serpula lacrymans var. lacrymans S7.3]